MRGLLALLVSVGLVSGCLDVDYTRCGDLYCATGEVCSPDHTQCVFPEQLTACTGQTEGNFCSYNGVPTGVCQGGVCQSQTSASLGMPDGFTASDGSSPDYVQLTWSAVDGATGYRVWRDSMAVMDVDTTSYQDTSAVSGGVPTMPGSFAASQGTDPTGVQLSWSASSVAVGMTHTYFVTALAAGSQSAPSSNDSGFRGQYPITGYEVSLDGGTAFSDEGIVTGYFDSLAPVGTWTGMAAASDGATGAVSLTLSNVTKVPSPRSYQVRAVSGAGHSIAAAATGSRDVGNPTGYQWQWSDTSSGTYTDVAGGTVANYDETTGPVVTVRYYRCQLSGLNGAFVILGPDSGSRALDKPTNVVASDGTSTSQVDVSWSGVYGATGYRVYRDSVQIAEVSGTSYADTGAAAGGAPNAPTSFGASQGTSGSGVNLTWAAPTVPAGTTHSYTVTALAGTTEGPASTADPGNRGGYPVTSYEVSIDGGSSYVGVGLVGTYSDATAPHGTWTGSADATDGISGKVSLSLASVTPSPVARTYYVRALSTGGVGTSSNASGWRSIGGPTGYQWQWSATSGGTYANLAGGTTASFDDTSGPVITPRFYRCLLSDGAGATATIGPDSGWRDLDAPANVVASDGTASAHVAISWGATFGATSYRVFRNGTAIADVTATTYNDTTAAGATSTPSAPTNFQASNGTFSDRVQLGWDAVTATNGPSYNYTVAALASGGVGPISNSDPGYRGPTPTTYELQIGSGAFTSVGTVTSFGDTTAPVGSYTLSASATDGIGVGITVTCGATPNAGASVTYTLRAVNPLGAGTATSATGARIAPAPTFQVQRSAAESDANFADIVGATSATWVDDAAQSPYPSFELRWFRCVVAGTGIAATTSGSDSGWRGVETTPSKSMWTATGPGTPSVNAAVVSGNTLYIGGNFSFVGPRTGAFAKVSFSTGSPDITWPILSGNTGVQAVAPDGTGGWYVVGDFVKFNFNPLSSAGVIHVTAAGGLDPAFVAPTISLGSIDAIAVDSGRVFLGGNFTTVGGVSHPHLAALNATSGALINTWTPSADAEVMTIAVSGSRLYIGGLFTLVSGTPRNYIAALDSTTGNLDTSWNPGADDLVRQIVPSGGQIFVCGNFLHVGGDPHRYLAAITNLGNVPAWDPNPSGGVDAMWPTASSVYVVGSFTTIGNTPSTRNGVAEINSTTGNATSFNPPVTQPFGGATLLLKGTTLYIGGNFASIFATPTTLSRANLVAIDTTSSAITSWNPGASWVVRVLATDGTSLFVGGNQMSVGGVVRSRAAALDLLTGQATAWDPNVTSASFRSVDSIAVTTSGVFLAGNFDQVGGQTRNGAAEVDTTTGALLPWNPAATGPVYTIASDGTNVYVGGGFTNIGGQARSRLASFTVSSGSINTWNPGANAGVHAFAFSGTNVIVGGDFTSIAATARNYLAAFDSSGSLLATWNPSPDNTVNTIVPFGPRIYIGGAFDNVSGVPRGHLAALLSASGSLESWRPASSATSVISIAVRGSVLYSCGAASGVQAADVINDTPNSDWQVFTPFSNPCALAFANSSLIAGGPPDGLVIYDP